MIRGLYTSGWSMLAIERKMDVIANNMANVNTNAYKKDAVVFESFPDILARRINDTRSRLNPDGLVGNMSLGSDVGEVFTYFNQGQLQKTDNKLDMALRDADAAFFTVSAVDANGDVKEFYTRDGAFALSPDSFLITKEGYAVMGMNGPVQLSGDSFSILPDGTIIQDDMIADRLLIKEFADTTALRKYGDNLLEAVEGAEETAFSGTVQQGYLELSNVNIIKEMVDMITVTRAYEANQKALQAQDGTLEKAVNEVGVVR